MVPFTPTGEDAPFTLERGRPRPRVIDYWLGGLQSLAAAGAEHCPHRVRGAEGPAPSRERCGSAFATAENDLSRDICDCYQSNENKRRCPGHLNLVVIRQC